MAYWARNRSRMATPAPVHMQEWKRDIMQIHILPSATFRVENVCMRVSVDDRPGKDLAKVGMTVRMGKVAEDYWAKVSAGALAAARPPTESAFVTTASSIPSTSAWVPELSKSNLTYGNGGIHGQTTKLSHISGLEFNAENSAWTSSLPAAQDPTEEMSRANSVGDIPPSQKPPQMKASILPKPSNPPAMPAQPPRPAYPNAAPRPAYAGAAYGGRNQHGGRNQQVTEATHKTFDDASFKGAGSENVGAGVLGKLQGNGSAVRPSMMVGAQETEGGPEGLPEGTTMQELSMAMSDVKRMLTRADEITRADDMQAGMMMRADDDEAGPAWSDQPGAVVRPADNAEVDELKGEVYGMRNDLERMFDMLAKISNKMEKVPLAAGGGMALEDLGDDMDERSLSVLRQFARKEAPWFVSGAQISFSGSKCIGEGTISYVFRGVYKDREVAVKMLKLEDPQAPGLPPFAVDLGNELNCVAVGLQHPHLVQFLGAGTRKVSGKLFPMIVYERMGGSILDVMQAQSESLGDAWVPPRAQSLAWCTHLMQALDYLHTFTVPLAHRDVRPANLLISGDLSTLKLGDFSLTTPVNGRGTQTYFVAGSLRYMAPEVSATGAVSYELDKSDIYSAALSCWCIIHGKRPYEDIDDSKQVVLLARHGLRPAISPRDTQIFQVLGAAWDGEPANRPPCKALAMAFGELARQANAPSSSAASSSAPSSRASSVKGGGKGDKGGGGGGGVFSKVKSFGSSFSSMKKGK